MDTPKAVPPLPTSLEPAGNVSEAELRYRAFFEGGPDGMLVLDPATARPIEFNDQACRQLGYTREEFARLTLKDIDAVQSEAEVRATVEGVLRGGKADFDTLQRTKRGDLRHVHVTAQVITAGGRTYYHCVWRDITERKRIEAELRESREKFRSIADHLSDMIAITDRRGVITYASPASRRLFGVDPEEGVGHSFTDYVAEESRPLARSAFEAMAERGPSGGLELRMKRNDGSTFIGEVSSTMYDVDGPEGRLVTIRDVTERRRQDEQLEVLKYSIDQAPAAAYWTDPEGAFTYVNDAACTALGYTRDELLRMHVSEVNLRATPDRWNEVWRTIKARGFLSIESEHRRKDGTTFPVELTSMYFGYRGREYCTGFAVDITERRRAELERETLQAQLAQSQKMESIGRLAGGVAHDNNNMLSVILGNLELALAEVDPTSNLYADLLEIQAAAQRSADLTRQLLAFARRQTVAPKVLDMNVMVEGMLNMLRRLIGEGISLEWSPRRELWPVRVDPTQVTQVLTNLAVNARDAVKDVGRVRIWTDHAVLDAMEAASLGECAAGEYVVLAVQDNGCGMPKDVVQHLFEPFYTTKAAGSGTGLGLATVYGIVHQNRGFIDVRSLPGAGTTFRIGFPRHAQRATEEASPSPTSSGGRETILLVEDEAAILRLGRRMLEGLGYHVLVATTPGEAIQVASKHGGRIDLLVSDVVMPEMNGRDLAKRLLTMYPHMRRLFMSGYTADVIAHHGVLEEGMHFLQKPFTAATLAAKVREAMG